MRPPALRIRLLFAAAASVTVALILAGIAISALFADHVERSRRVDLEAQLNRLAALIDPTTHPPKLSAAMADPRFGVPFGGLYWQVSDPVTDEVIRSRSLWDSVLAMPAGFVYDGTLQNLYVVDPEGSSAIALARQLEFVDENGGTRLLDIIIAEDDVRTKGAITAFRMDLTRGLTILGVTLIIAAWFQVSLGLAPLKTISQGISAIRSGKTTRLKGPFPLEVMPLITEVNALMEIQDSSIAFARARAADLAHGLKTDLTVLNSEAQALREQGQSGRASAIEALAADMADTIDHQLRLSRLRFRTRSDHYSTPLAETASKIINALKKTPKGLSVHWETQIPTTLKVDLEGPDLTELLGILLDNAMKWASSRVEISVKTTAEKARLVIADDGPGVIAAQMAELGERGKRLDERKPGNGIGLSIAREILTFNNGTISFSKSNALGGLEVLVELPIATVEVDQAN